MIIHDLNERDAKKCDLKMKGENIIANNSEIKNCIGCFGCWIKDPGRCVIKDDYCHIGEMFSKSSEIKIISECWYGGYSDFVTNVLDRCISYILPYVRVVNGEVHHKLRYKNSIEVSVYFYGDDMTDKEKKTARKIVEANSKNIEWDIKAVMFMTKQELLEGKYNDCWSC